MLVAVALVFAVALVEVVAAAADDFVVEWNLNSRTALRLQVAVVDDYFAASRQIDCVGVAAGAVGLPLSRCYGL